ncbi:sulfurtransferase [Verrucomicrobiaceae bacterium SCGC AG-212-N21]|nr:sulfurtransferase [Verrucomicrobiaceae bacterium SCGC AG-212-N21]
MKLTSSLLALVAAFNLLAVCSASAEIGLITCADAKKLIEDPDPSKRPIVLDTRGGYKDYFRGHLPTAHHINFDTLRGTDKAVPVQYLPEDLTRALLTRAGIDKDRLHLVYATGDVLPNDEILSTSMVVFVLEKYGVKNIKIVDGGFAEWKKQGLTPARDYFGNPEGKLPAETDFGIAANAEDVKAHVGKPGNVLVDARPLNEFQGDDEVWLRKGHIPGAVSFHWARLMEKDNTHKFKPFEEVKAQLEAAGITKDKNIIAYCGTSREGSLLLFYLKHVAGYPNVRLYEGAWKEWVWLDNKSLPAETGGAAAGLADAKSSGKTSKSKKV